MKPSKRGAALAVVGILAGGLTGAVVAATPAAADPTYARATNLSWAYTDSAHPGESHQSPDWHTDLPVGTAIPPGEDPDTSRVYATFDLSPFAGKHILTANVFAQAASDADCAKTAVDIWQTSEPTGKISWNKSPAEVVKIGSLAFGGGCPSDYLHSGVTDAVVAAVAAGKTKFSLEIRVRATYESDPSYAFSLYGYNGVVLDIGYNTPPTTPTELKVESNSCSNSAAAPDYSGTLRPALSATAGDVDWNSEVRGDFAVWPVDHPDQRVTFDSAPSPPSARISTIVPAGVLEDGGSYAWRVRADDGIDTSDWSETCYLNIDATPPSAAPGVDSPNYPQGNQIDPAGAPMTFYLTPSGVNDVVKYSYGFNGSPNAIFVPASSDGSATVTIAPPTSGEIDMMVVSYDRAGNQSPYVRYDFILQRSGPLVTYDSAAVLGAPFHFSMTPNPNAPAPVDSYQVRVNNGDWTTVAADGNGDASSTYTPEQAMSLQINVRSHSANGWLSEPVTIYETVTSAPKVTSPDYPEFPDGPAGGVGVEGTFDFTAALPHAASFTYEFDYGSDTTVSADANGHASITWTPDTADFHILTVVETTADGSTSEAYTYYFLVNE